jgi:hypothetical protein
LDRQLEASIKSKNKIEELEKIVVELQMQLIARASEPEKSAETETTVSADNIEIKIVEEQPAHKGPLIRVEGD